jgi:signal transduction histidine kinase
MDVSSVGMPTWDGRAQGLAYPDQVISVDGRDLTAGGIADGPKLWNQAVLDAEHRAAQKVHARVRTKAGEREVDLRIDRIEPALWWLYGGGLVFTGGLYIIAALTAISASPRGKLARAFAKFAVITGVYYFAFFDSYTSRVLEPLFYFSFGWAPLTFMGVALRLPDDAPIARRFPMIFPVLDLIGIAAGSTMALRVIAGESTHALRSAWTGVLGVMGLGFVVIVVARFLMAEGRRRAILRLVVQTTAVPYAVVALGLLAASGGSRSATIAFLAVPFTALAPLATVVAFARNDLWGSRALLSRVVTRAVTGALGCAVSAGIAGAFAASLGIPCREGLAAAAAGAVASGPLVYVALRAVDRTFFPAVTEYKPTIEQLSEDLTSISGPEEIASAVERTVRRWLPCDRVEFVPFEEAMPAPPPPEHVEQSIPAKFGGRTLGALLVGEKRGGALYTSADVDLLQTIANQAALALAYARSYAELEERRRQQAAAWQVERLALVETLAAEVAHEVRYPINYFRSVFQRTPEGATLSADEMDVGCEEVERLERLVAGLRRLVGYNVERRTVSLLELTTHAEIVLRDALGGRALRVDVPVDVSLRCDPDQVRQVVVNLVSNALDASGPQGKVGIGWTETEGGAELCVWDDGPGFRGDASALFAPWFTTKPHGTGLGLAISQRIVRAHNWTIDAVRVERTTRFVVAIPRPDIVGGASPDEAPVLEAS